MLEAEAAGGPEWSIPIMRTIATEGAGIPELSGKIRAHAQFLHDSGNWDRREVARLAAEVNAILHEALRARFDASVPEGRYNEVMQQVALKKLSPEQAVDMLIAQSQPPDPGTSEGRLRP